MRNRLLLGEVTEAFKVFAPQSTAQHYLAGQLTKAGHQYISLRVMLTLQASRG